MAQHAHRTTCKVVLAPNQVGARVYPKGCKVRYILKPNGTVVKRKRSTGQEKPKKTTRVVTGRDFHVYLAYEGNSFAPFRRFLWDTGATNTQMSRRTAHEMGIIDQDAPGWQPAEELEMGVGGLCRIASGARVPYSRIKDVPFEINSDPNVPVLRHASEVVSGDVIIMEGNASSLFGVSHIKHVKQTKVKFRPPLPVAAPAVVAAPAPAHAAPVVNAGPAPQAGQGSSGGGAFIVVPPPGWS